MATTLVSPGIQIKEYDLSGYIPGVSTSVAALGGVFSWGPVEQRTLINDENSLVLQFGRPTDDNFETFHIASNFLSYSNALYISRAADGTALNAVAGEAGALNVQIKNLSDFTINEGTLDANSHFYARYPSEYGNALEISVCASSEAFTSVLTTTDGFNTLTVDYVPNSTTVELEVLNSQSNSAAAVVELANILDELQIGEFITVQSPNQTTQYVQIAAIGTPDEDTGNDKATATITLTNRFSLVDPVTLTSIERNWRYFQLFDRAPGTSTYAQTRGGAGDEMHIVVLDTTGKFTGQANQILEIYPFVSRATDARTEQGSSNFFRTILNDSSAYVYATNNIPGVVSGLAENLTPITIRPYTKQFTGGASGLSESAMSLSALANAYDQFKSKEDVDVSLIIAGKAVGGTHGEGLANYIIDNIAEVRKDCIVTVSPQMNDVVGANFREVENLIQFRRAVRYSGRGFLTTSYKLQFDRYNNKNRWVAGCGDDAGLMARTDFERDPWWSPAGQNRGIYKNIIRLAFNPNQAQRDALYKDDINPVINQVGSGVILYGDKTLLGKPSAFDRINVRRLFDTLEKAIEKYARGLLFEFNDIYTRARFRNTVEPYLRDVMGRRGIVRYKVVCDESNNPPVVIDRNEFVGSIYIVPAKSINFITLNFVALANTVSFEYAIGEVDGQPI